MPQWLIIYEDKKGEKRKRFILGYFSRYEAIIKAETKYEIKNIISIENII